MNNISRKKLFIVAFAIMVLIGIAVPTSIHAYNNSQYNKNFELGKKALDDREFDNAGKYFKACLKYNSRKESEINSELDLVNLIKQSDISYKQAMQLYNDKKYIDAIDAFKKVSDKDKKNYIDAQDKITLCRDTYINGNIESAKKEAENKNYEGAIKYLDIVLTFDTENKDASSLKNQYNDEIARIKHEEEARKKAEEDAAKLASQQKTEQEGTQQKAEQDAAKLAAQKKPTQAAADTAKSTGSSNTAASVITTTVYPDAIAINDSGKTYRYTFRYSNGDVFNSKGYAVTHSFATLTDPAAPQVNYTIKFTVTDDNQVFTYSGQTTDNAALPNYTSAAFLSNYPEGQELSITAEITIMYKGKPYTFTSSLKLSA